MDIDFLKSQTKSSKAHKKKKSFYDVEYTVPGSDTQQTPKIKKNAPKAIKKEKQEKKSPPKAPATKQVKLPSTKLSLWQKLKYSFRKKPKVQTKKDISPKFTKPTTIQPAVEQPILVPQGSVEAQQQRSKKKEAAKENKKPEAKAVPTMAPTQETKEVPSPIPVPAAAPSLPVSQPVSAVPTSIPKKVPATKIPAVKKKQKQKEDGLYVQPSIKKGEDISDLDKKQLEKIKKGELAKGFLDVNLIPKELIAELRPTTKLKSLTWLAVLMAIIVIVIYGSMAWYQNTLEKSADVTTKEIGLVEQQIFEYTNWQTKALAFNERVENVSNILSHRIYWTSFFSLLEKYTLPNVFYKNLSGDVSGTFTLSAVAPDYETVSQQVASFQQADFISEVSVISANAEVLVKEQEGKAPTEEQIVNFNISISVKPEIFYSVNEL